MLKKMSSVVFGILCLFSLGCPVEGGVPAYRKPVYPDKDLKEIKVYGSYSSIEGGVLSLTGEAIKNPSPYRQTQKVIVSGFYYEKEDTFIPSKTEVYPANWISSSFKKRTEEKFPIITFQIREKNNILKEIKKPCLKMEMELIYTNGSSQTFPFPATPFTVSFNLPTNYKKRNLRFYVLNPKGQVVYSTPVWKNKNQIKSTVLKLTKMKKER